MPLQEDPQTGFTGKWTRGIFVAAFSVIWGTYSLAIGKLVLSRRFFTFEGPSASALSVALISFGLYLHFHYFWGTNPKADHISTFGGRVFAWIGSACLALGLGIHVLGLAK
jgi:hypothetical protein